MFSSKANYLMLRTNLRLCINRFKLLEKKKSKLLHFDHIPVTNNHVLLYIQDLQTLKSKILQQISS